MKPAPVLELIRRLRDGGYESTAEKVERALLVRTVQVRLSHPNDILPTKAPFLG